MDWSLFHLLNGALRGDDPAQDAVEVFDAGAIFVLAAAVALLWLIARPGGSVRSKLAAASAALAAPLALLLDAGLGRLWFHDRPFVDHPKETVLLVRHAADNSFPSDHASVAFAIAFAVVLFHRRLGLAFLAGAVLIGLDRILVGVHYPLDVAVSALVGLAAALLVGTLGRPHVAWAVRHLSRLSDPVLVAVASRLTRTRRRHTRPERER